MNEKITLQDIVNLFSQKQGIGKKEADLIVRTMFDLIEEALKTENYVKIKGFGTFKLTEVDARESVNVNTGERFEIQGHSKISFTPDTTMKDLINKPFAHFETVILNDGVELEDTPTEEVAEAPEMQEEAPAIGEATPAVTEETPVVVEETIIEETPATEVTEVPVVEEEPAIVEEAPAVEEPIEECEKAEEEQQLRHERRNRAALFLDHDPDVLLEQVLHQRFVFSGDELDAVALLDRRAFLVEFVGLRFAG